MSDAPKNVTAAGTAWQPLHEWAKDYARRQGFGKDVLEVIDALADALAVRAVAPAGASSDAAIAAARAVAAEAELERWDPSYKVRQMLRAAYAVDFGAAAPRDAPHVPREG
jgi:ribosomal protein L12E/L44/L45/RPP1/RPP2